jgi:folate-binding protein YgfZ
MVYHGATLLETNELFERAIITKVRKMSQKLSDTILEFNGSDARTVLQGQTTRNFTDALEGSVLEGAFCDLKGRVIADFCAVIVSNDCILLRTNIEVAARLVGHLQKYLMFSKTKLSTSDMSVWGCEIDAPSETCVITDDAVTVQRGGNLAEVWTRENSVPTNAMSPDVYRIRRLEQGDAKLTSEIIGKYLPQDLNFDINGRVDFNKGCYTGQEIIARLHFRGEPKRRLRLLSLASYEDIAPGERVLNAEGKSIGSVIEAVANDEVTLCLCEVVIDVDNQGPHILGQAAVASDRQQF